MLASTVLSVAPIPGPAQATTASPITIAFTGDDLGSPALWPAARRYADGHGLDFRPMLARLRPLIRSANLAICHLETPLSGPAVPPSGSPRYVAPHQLAAAIRYAGYDGCSTASNHTLDAGTVGIRSTLDALDAQGVSHTGSARTKRESRSIVRYQVGDVVVAHLAYTFGFNGLRPERVWMANRIDPDAIITRAERARREGADLVVVSLHWGQEFSHAVSPDQDRIARRLAGSDAIDLIVGHHAHVVQPIRRVGGRWVAFGAGNSLTGMTADGFVPEVQDGMVVLVTFAPTADSWEVSKIRFAPTWVQPGPFIVRLVGPALDKGSLPAAVVEELRRSWARTVGTVAAPKIGVMPFRGARLKAPGPARER